MRLFTLLFILMTSSSSLSAQVQAVRRSVIYLGKLIGLGGETSIATEITGQTATTMLRRIGKAEYLEQGYYLCEKCGVAYLIKQPSHFPPQLYSGSLQIDRIKYADNLIEEYKKTSKSYKKKSPEQEELEQSIRSIQYSINVLLRQRALKTDGFAGPKTKEYIHSIFGLDCSGKTDEEIVALLHDRNPLTRKADENSPQKVEALPELNSRETKRYTLTIKQQIENQPTRKEHLTKDQLNKEIEQFNIKCSLGDICLNTSEKNASATVSCKDRLGNKVELTISTEASADLSFKTSDGLSSKLSIDKEGKLELSQTRKRIIEE